MQCLAVRCALLGLTPIKRIGRVKLAPDRCASFIGTSCILCMWATLAGIQNEVQGDDMDHISNHEGVVKAVLFVLLSLVVSASHADEFSCRPQKYDPEFPAALLGKYEIIGRMPDSDATYGGGTIEINAGKTAYEIKRTLNGSAMTGEA